MRRGDVAVFVSPGGGGGTYIKRVVGLPGDTLEMRDKTLFVNGREMQEYYVSHIDRNALSA